MTLVPQFLKPLLLLQHPILANNLTLLMKIFFVYCTTFANNSFKELFINEFKGREGRKIVIPFFGFLGVDAFHRKESGYL